MLYNMCNKRVLKVIELHMYLNLEKMYQNLSTLFVFTITTNTNKTLVDSGSAVYILIVNSENFDLFDKQENSFRDL